MDLFWVAAAYGSAFVLAMYLLWHFGTTRWFWHVAAIAAAFTIGMIPLTGPFSTAEGTVAVGWLFLLLFLWGAAAPLFRTHHHHRH